MSAPISRRADAPQRTAGKHYVRCAAWAARVRAGARAGAQGAPRACLCSARTSRHAYTSRAVSSSEQKELKTACAADAWHQQSVLNHASTICVFSWQKLALRRSNPLTDRGSLPARRTPSTKCRIPSTLRAAAPPIDISCLRDIPQSTRHPSSSSLSPSPSTHPSFILSLLH